MANEGQPTAPTLDPAFVAGAGTPPSAAPVYQAQTPTLDPAFVAGAGQPNDAQTPTQTAQPGSPSSPLKGIIEFTNKLREAYQVGEGGIREAALGQAVASGSLTLEDALQRRDSDEQLKWKSNNVDEYEQRSWPMWGEGLLVGAAMEGVKSLPIMAQQFQPPESSEQLAGAIAPLVHVADWTGKYTFGQDYLRRRLAGAPHEDAARYAAANGMVQGVVAALSFMPLGGVAANAAKVPMQAAKPLIMRALSGLAQHAVSGAKFTATQEGFALTGSVVQNVLDAVEGTVSKNGFTAPPLKEASKEFWETFTKTAGMSLLLHEGASALGLGMRGIVEATKVAKDVHLQRQTGKLARMAEERQKLLDGYKGSIEADEPGDIGELTDSQKRKMQADAVLAEQKTRLAQQEKELTKLDRQINKAKRKGDQGLADELLPHRDTLNADTGLLSDIVDSAEKIARGEAEKRIKRLLKQSEISKQAGSKVERIVDSPGLQEALDIARDFVNHPDKVGAVLQEDMLEGSPLTKGEDPKAQLVRDVATLVGDVRLKDSVELDHLADQIELAYQAGRKGRLKQIELRNIKRTAQVNLVKEAITFAKDISGSVNRLKDPLMTPLGMLRNGIIAPLGNWEQIWYPALRGMTDWKDFYRDHLDPSKIVSAVGKGIMDWHQRKFELLAEATGLTKAQVLELQRGGRRKKQIEFFADNGDEISMSAMEAVKLLGEARNDKLNDRFIKANHYPENFESIVGDQLDELDPAYKKLVDGYEKFYVEYKKDLAATFKKDKGYDMPEEEHYAGYVSSTEGEQPERNSFIAQLDQGTNNQSKAKGTPGFLKKRTSSSAIQLQDAEAAARGHIALGERYKAWLEPSKEKYGPILRDRETRRMISNKAGPIVLWAIDHGYKWLLNGSAKAEVQWAGFVDKLFSGIRFNTMAWNLLYAPEHAMSAFAGAQYIPINEYLRGLADFAIHPFETLKSIQHITKTSDIYKERYQDIEQVESGASLPKVAQNPDAPKILNDIAVAYHKGGMSAISVGSRAQVLPIIHSVYSYWRRQGWSDADAMHEAGRVAENVATSMRPEMTSTLSHVPGGKYALMFQQQVNKFAVDQIIAQDMFWANPSVETLRNAAKTQLITGTASAVFPLTRALYNYQMSKDRNKKDEAVFQAELALTHALVPGSGGAIISTLSDYELTKAYNAKTGKNFDAYTVSIPALEVVKNDQEFFGLITSDLIRHKWKAQDQAKAGAAFLRGPGMHVSLGLKNPVGFAEKLTEKKK